MQEKFTRQAENVLKLAKNTAQSCKHSYIGTEHILVGLLRERTGVAAKVLLDAGIEEEKLTELIEDLIAPSASVAVLDPDGYSPRTEKVLENADKEAERFHCREVGTEHLLIALDADRIRALEETGEALRMVLARARCKNISRQEIHDLIDEIYDNFY